jgi:hypothetical protein
MQRVKHSPALFRKIVDRGAKEDSVSKDSVEDEDADAEVTVSVSDESGKGRVKKVTPFRRFKGAQEYSVNKTLKDISDVGQLRVHLVQARGLFGADLLGKSDPFATLRLRDVEFESSVIKKTLKPEWNESFVFQVNDMSDILYVTLWDEDRFNDPEFLGMVAIPLLSIHDGLEKCYAMKDEVSVINIKRCTIVVKHLFLARNVNIVPKEITLKLLCDMTSAGAKCELRSKLLRGRIPRSHLRSSEIF